MMRWILFTLAMMAFGAALPGLGAQPASPPGPAPASAKAPATADEAANPERANATAAAAAVSSGRVVRTPDLLEHVVDSILGLFDVKSSGNTTTHWVIFALLIMGALLLRRIVTGILFRRLKRLAARTQTTLDDKLFPALEGPGSSLIVVFGIFAALKVLKLSEEADHYIAAGSTVAFSLVIFWGLWRALSVLLDHGLEIARSRNLGIAAFMPWIKKTLLSVFAVLGVLLTAQSLGFEVKTFLAGLGIGGLAFALAAQDTIANLFGSVVVAIDQPFKVGEFVRIGSLLGGVEDIGLRSTRLRSVDKSLIIIPNKTVAAEAVTNLSRFSQRRAEQVISLTYDTTVEQMNAIVEDFRRIVRSDSYVDPSSILIYFRDFAASSLDIWIVYVTKDGDFARHMETRQRFNLEFMRAVHSRGLVFALPTQVMHLGGPVAEQLAAGQSAPDTDRKR